MHAGARGLEDAVREAVILDLLPVDQHHGLQPASIA